MELPKDFAARRNLVILAFRQWQQAQVDGWIEWAADEVGLPAALPGSAPGDAPWAGNLVDAAIYEIPLLGRRWSVGRNFIDGGMAAAIRDPVILARTVTVYTDVSAVMGALGIDSTDDVCALVVDDDAGVLARVSGACIRDRQRPIRAALTLSM